MTKGLRTFRTEQNEERMARVCQKCLGSISIAVVLLGKLGGSPLAQQSNPDPEPPAATEPRAPQQQEGHRLPLPSRQAPPDPEPPIVTEPRAPQSPPDFNLDRTPFRP